MWGGNCLTPGAPVIDPKTLQRKSVHRLNHKMDQVVLGHPLTKIRRQKHRRISVNRNKSRSDGLRLPNSKADSKADSKSDRLLASSHSA